MKLPVTILFLILLCSRVPAQNIIPRFENIGVNDGLSQSSVYSIYQDKKGFMWFGTADGLNRYDGQDIKVYKISDKSIANSNFIHGNICEDSHGSIWFCNETGLFCYDPLPDKLTRKTTFSKYTWTAGIFIDDKDIFYIINPASGVYEYHINTNRFALSACGFKKPYTTFASGGLTTNFKNTIWLKAPGDNGLIIYNTVSQKVSYRKIPFKFHSVFYGNNGRLYYLQVPGKLTVTDTSLRVLDSMNYVLPKNKMLSIQAICTDNYHRLWISTSDNGLICYNGLIHKFSGYLHNNAKQKSLPINLLSALCIDRSGNLWIGSDGSGISKLDLKPPKFNLFPLNEGDYTFLKDYFIKCFYEDERGRIWFGTHSSGFNIYDPLTGEVKNYPFQSAKAKGLPGPIISNILKDRHGLIWICSSMGISVFNEKKGTFSTIRIINSPGLNEHNSFVYKLMELQNGDLLAATFWGLLTIKKVGGVYTGIFNLPSPEKDVLITDVVEMGDHTVWASSPLHGLYHYKKTGDDFTIIDKYFPLIDLRSIHIDERDKNTLWVGTGIGLIKFNTITHQQTRYDERAGMANSYVYGILEDKQYNFWISTNMGLCFFNRQANTFQNYTVKDGLQSNEFNTQAFYKGPSGNMYFGGIKGFNWFNPESIKTAATTAPGVAITSININDKPYVKDSSFTKNKTISLSYYQNSISFQFAALDFTRPQANKVQFILEPWDKKWITTDDKNIRYTHLLPGNYVLKVKAANNDGIWSSEEKLNLVVNAPFWQQTWFYILSAMLFLVIIIYITWFVSHQKILKRLRQLEKQHAIDAERNRISRDMHDEIGSGLTHIALLSELIQTQKKTDNAIKSDLGNISIAARKLVESMSEIIWALNPQNDSLENLLSYMREQMQQHFEPFELKLTINFPDEVGPVKLTNEQRRNLYLVTKEALNNVMKHSGAKKVQLTFSPEPEGLNFEVHDDGTGMPEKLTRATGNGLKNMRKRMEDIGGRIEWVNLNKGLKVVYSLVLDS
jgi:signal transduction histidine kinase/ligand-binding sensor domain-containing protein